MAGWRAAGWRWFGAWALATLLAATAVVRWDIAARREAFQAEARTAHRLLSQRAAELDAVLATLLLLAPEPGAERAETRLPALYPQVMQVLRRDGPAPWPQAGFAAAEATSRARRRAVLAAVDTARRQFTLLRADADTGVALVVDVARWLPAADWPFRADGPVAARLVLDGRTMALSAGAPERGITPGFVFAKTLGTPSQPFELQVQRYTGPADWPWAVLAGVAGALALLMAAIRALLGQRAARRRAEELLRLARVARLNTLGEMAAGLAHELNQPLTAVLASTQAARRLLDDDPPPRALLEEALEQSRDQARRAAEVVARMRRRIEQPEAAPESRPVALDAALQRALALLQPELDARRVQLRCSGRAGSVLADPVALDQILHNLLRNALQALEDVPADARTLALDLSTEPGFGVLTVHDSGPGLAPEVLARLFQPFTSTRPDGLGLGLSLSESLAVAMGGRLSAQNATPRGAAFRLALPSANSP